MSINQEKLIAFDADGVLTDSQTPIIEATNQRLGTHFSFESWVTYEFLFEQAIKLTGESPSTVAAWMFATPVMLASEPYKDALLLSQQLDEMGFRQAVITSRPVDQKDMTMNWFETHYPWINPDDIFLKEQDSTLTGDQFKLAKIDQLKPMTFTDDSDQLIRFILAHRLNQQNCPMALLLRDRPWNTKATDLAENRINDMSQILAKLRSEESKEN